MRLLLLSTTMLLFSIIAIGQANRTANDASGNNKIEADEIENRANLLEQLKHFTLKRDRDENQPDSIRSYDYPTELDSVNQGRTVFQYGDNEETRIHYDWDSESMSWQLSSKTYLTYNSQDLLLDYIQYAWDEDNNEWEPVMKLLQDYTDQGLHTLWSQEFWDETNNEWRIEFKTTYEYNSSLLLSTMIHREWSDESGSVEIEYKEEYDYTDFDSISEVTTYSHDGNTFNLDELEERSYGDNQYLDQKTMSWWDPTLELWQYDYKWEYSYNSDMLFSEREGFTYDLASFEWNEDELYEYSYNADNLVSALLNHEWDDGAGSYTVDDKKEWYYNDTLVTTYIREIYSSTEGGLENYYKEEFAYNGNHKNTLNADYTWDPQEDEWIPGLKHTTQYNEYGDKSVVSNYEEDPATGNWELDTRDFWHYDLATNIAAGASEDLSLEVYPNPARSHVNLEASLNEAKDVRVAIYNQAGEELFSRRLENFTGNETIHWNSDQVTPGIYMAEFTTEDERLTKKIVVK